MSGPDPYRTPAGANAIGRFAIGVSGVGMIGNIPPFDWWQTVISQYANSGILTTLISNFFDYIDQTRNVDAFFNLIRNVDTAQGYGLDVWGRIVAVNRVLKLGVGPRYFGFEEGLPDYDPFDTSPLWSGQSLTENYALSDDGFRVLILAKAFSNICDGSIGSINTLLRMLFGTSGRCYVTDDGGMAMTYVFEFPLTPLQRAIVTQSGVLPRPAGVSATISEV